MITPVFALKTEDLYSKPTQHTHITEPRFILNLPDTGSVLTAQPSDNGPCLPDFYCSHLPVWAEAAGMGGKYSPELYGGRGGSTVM